MNKNTGKTARDLSLASKAFQIAVLGLPIAQPYLNRDSTSLRNYTRDTTMPLRTGMQDSLGYPLDDNNGVRKPLPVNASYFQVEDSISPLVRVEGLKKGESAFVSAGTVIGTLGTKKEGTIDTVFLFDDKGNRITLAKETVKSQASCPYAGNCPYQTAQSTQYTVQRPSHGTNFGKGSSVDPRIVIYKMDTDDRGKGPKSIKIV